MIKFLKSLLFPQKCLFCGETIPEGVFCPKCRLEYDKMKRRPCRICHKPHEQCRCMPGKLIGVVDKAHHLFAYGDRDSKIIVFTLKERDHGELQRVLARDLARLVSDGAFDITFAPRKPKSVREFGFDQAERLAEVMSKQLGLPLVELFCHGHFSKLQKNLDAAHRAANAEKSYTLKTNIERKHETLVIVDDVMTTGSTMAKLAALAKDAGYTKIVALTVARTEREENE